MRRGSFLFQLAEWSERPCVLTIAIPSVSSRLRIAGILRAYYSLASTHGWALVPPEQHGGFATVRMTELCFDRATMRVVIDDGAQRKLRYLIGDAVFTVERDDAPLTGPPRATRTGRYLYVGGRRRRIPEPWMYA